MGVAYSQDLRDRVLAAYDRGMTTKQIAEVFEVSPAWARRIKQRRAETGETTPRPVGGRRRWKIDRVRLAELLVEHPDATLKELRAMLGIECAESAICVAVRKLGFTFKKRRSTRPSRIVRMSPSVVSSGSKTNPTSTPDG